MVLFSQACFRGWYARKRYLYLKRDVCVLQEMARVVLSKARCRTLRNTVVQLQALTRQRFAIFFLQQEKHHQERQSLTQSPALNAKPASRRCPRRRRKAQALGILDRPRVYQVLLVLFFCQNCKRLCNYIFVMPDAAIATGECDVKERLKRCKKAIECCYTST